MSISQLVPISGQTPSIGYGLVIFSSPNAPKVSQGDAWEIDMIGQVPNVAEIGHQMPWETSLTYDGPTDANGSIKIKGTCAAPGDHYITDAPGVVFATGVLPNDGNFQEIPQGGHKNLFGGNVCLYGAPVPPPPPIVPSLQTLANAVEASKQTRVPVADWRQDGNPVPFVCAPPYTAPYGTTVPITESLSDAASARIAELSGGVVKKIAPPAWAAMYAQSPLPFVNGIFQTVNGVPSFANAAEVAMSFDVGMQQGDVLGAITKTFQPV